MVVVKAYHIVGTSKTQVYCMQYLVKTATEPVSLVVYEENYVIGDGDDDESEGLICLIWWQ